LSTLSPGWEFSPDWGTSTSFGATETTIVYGSITDEPTNPESITYKINAVTSAAEAAGKKFNVAVVRKAQRAVAVIVTEV
jgi:hypothetical protein